MDTTTLKQAPKVEKSFLQIPGARWTKELGVLTFPRLDGEEGRWEFIKAPDEPTVLLLGLTEEKKIIIVNLYRFPTATFCNELPGGTIDSGESKETAVKREFVEETGYVAETVSKLCSGFLWNGKSNATFEIWLGESCTKISAVQLDPVEKTAGLSVEEMSVPEIAKRIAEGDLSLDPVLCHGIVALMGKGML